MLRGECVLMCTNLKTCTGILRTQRNTRYCPSRWSNTGTQMSCLPSTYETWIARFCVQPREIRPPQMSLLDGSDGSERLNNDYIAYTYQVSIAPTRYRSEWRDNQEVGGASRLKLEPGGAQRCVWAPREIPQWRIGTVLRWSPIPILPVQYQSVPSVETNKGIYLAWTSV